MLGLIYDKKLRNKRTMTTIITPKHKKKSSDEPDERVWIVYTTDFRFPTSPTQFNSAYTSEELAQQEVERINAEHEHAHLSSEVVRTGYVPLLPRAELDPWD
jgi:hypothetical protein